ncbi:MAG: HD domain-containing protein [Candidatus Schekmanbacteria bacterium]|nr:HD domain-containing protein [Candidatus Schekmanbacteria bacterium]
MNHVAALPQDEHARSLNRWQSALRLLDLAAHTLSFVYVRVRHARLARSLRPFAAFLERELFPALMKDQRNQLEIECVEDSSFSLRARIAERDFYFPGVSELAATLWRIGVRKLALDIRLEEGQIVESILLLAHVAPHLCRQAVAAAPAAAWRAQSIARSVTSPDGYHRFCAIIRFDVRTRVLSVQYHYCELLFSSAVRHYVSRRARERDHRALFRLAPRAAAGLFGALAVISLFAPPATVLGRLALLLPFGLLLAVAVGTLVHGLGSLQYDREHHEQLIDAYLEEIDVLSRFPRADPNPILKINDRGEIAYSNPAAQELLRSLLLPVDSPENLLPKDYAKSVTSCLANRNQVETWEHVVAQRHIRYTVTAFLEERAVIAAGTDITQIRALQSALEELSASLEEQVVARTDELYRTQDAIVLCLVGLSGMRHKETGQHLERTRRYVQLLARELQSHPRFSATIDDAFVTQLFKAAPLHDVGKVGIPDAILLKPSSLTRDEFELMKKHTTYGGDSLRLAEEQLGFPSFVTIAREIAYHHHEKWDGNGYPARLSGDDIPVSARLMALADVYDALTVDRVYRPAIPHARVREMILADSGTHFDPDVVEAFKRVEDDFIEVSRQFREDVEEAVSVSV